MKQTQLIATLLLICSNVVLSHYGHMTPEEIGAEVDEQMIFYGSTIRLKNIGNSHHLHSHDVQYGTGSGQQSVTGITVPSDYNSLWTIKEGHQEQMATFSDEVKCGDMIRLEHMLTKQNLHSHGHRSPISNEQEVSAYGIDGYGDIADNWIVDCAFQEQNTTLMGSSLFYLRHQESNKYLRVSRNQMFNKNNCGRNCPIEGQLESAAISSKNAECQWKIVGGLLFEQQYKIIEEEDEYNKLDARGFDQDGYEEVKIKREDL